MLLERVGEVARERTESVSSKVHTQLLQLADERAMVAEQRAQDLEREVSAICINFNVVTFCCFSLSDESSQGPTFLWRRRV